MATTFTLSMNIKNISYENIIFLYNQVLCSYLLDHHQTHPTVRSILRNNLNSISSIW